MLKTFKIFIFLIIFQTILADHVLTEGTLKVIRNKEKAQFENETFQLYPASFSTSASNINDYIITVVRAEPFDACTSLSQPKDYYQTDYPIFILVDGGAGKCGYKRRAQMAKNYFGAKGVIIIDDSYNGAEDPYSSYQDETFLVFLTRGEAGKLEEMNFFTGSITMKTLAEEKADVSIWLSALNKQSYQTLKIWKQTLKQIPQIAKKVNWKPRYATYGCNDSSIYSDVMQCDTGYLPFCACNGAFCSPQVSKQTPDLVIREDIRQKIIFYDYTNQYLNYTQKFYKECYKKFKEQYTVEDCSAKVLNSLFIDASKINKEIDNNDECKGKVFEELLLDRNRFRQLNYYPSVIVHRQPIEFKNKNEFQSKICQRLGMEKVTACMEIIKYQKIITTSLNILFFVAIVAGLIAVGALVVLCYRKTLRKEMQKEVKMQVSSSVENYFALTEGKE